MRTIEECVKENSNVDLKNKEVFDKIMSTKIVINRVPKITKGIFTKLAKDEFADDYGMALASILKEAEEYKKLKDMFFKNKIRIIHEK